MITRLCVCLLLFVLWSGTAWAEALRVLVLPFTNTVTLLKLHQPLRQHLQNQLGREVQLFTSADFAAHFQDIRSGSFDVLITGPHFGAWAVDHGQIPLLRYRPALRPLLVVRQNSPIRQASDLRGRTVALSNRLSISSIAGEGWLNGKGLQAGRDYVLTISPTHTAAIMAVAAGDADAAITTHTPLQQSPADIRDAVRELPTEASLPHLFTLANQSLPPSLVQQIRAALLDFEQTRDGSQFFQETGYQGYVPLTEQDISIMRPYVDVLLRSLAP